MKFKDRKACVIERKTLLLHTVFEKKCKQ